MCTLDRDPIDAPAPGIACTGAPGSDPRLQGLGGGPMRKGASAITPVPGGQSTLFAVLCQSPTMDSRPKAIQLIQPIRPHAAAPPIPLPTTPTKPPGTDSIPDQWPSPDLVPLGRHTKRRSQIDTWTLTTYKRLGP
uniref:Uncharacterized protein n=1 Tax=Eutreptiella gymnastica TaxID=73025 RepID=A0A7S1NC13_9EUGL|mmetsp:Transcript_15414/g.27305  ORF Transcript_15414/g.27305 Transcript_15414/m.27305 type:complete len:136 (+) Transcript_15414:77-484(+)